jgi:hypothetical protein
MRGYMHILLLNKGIKKINEGVKYVIEKISISNDSGVSTC